MISATILAVLAAQAASAPRKPDAFDLALRGKDAAVTQVAEAMHEGFKTCARQVADRAHLSAANKAELDKAGVTLRETPPDEVAIVAATLFKEAPIYAELKSPAGSVWLIASASLPACKVTVADTSGVPGARAELNRLFGTAEAWSPDLAQSFDKDGLVRQAYVLNKDKPGPHMVTFVDGPNEVVNDGKGIQSIITVGVQKADVAAAETK